MDHVEVDQQSNGLAAEFEIRNHLCLMNGRDPFHRFDLHDHEIFHQQVDPISKFQLDPAIDYWKPYLSFRMHASLSKFKL